MSAEEFHDLLFRYLPIEPAFVFLAFTLCSWLYLGSSQLKNWKNLGPVSKSFHKSVIFLLLMQLYFVIVAISEHGFLNDQFLKIPK
jgi:hypothetical protein